MRSQPWRVASSTITSATDPEACSRSTPSAWTFWIDAVAIADRILDAAIDLCRKEGYRTLYAHSQKRFLKVWESRGFRLMDGRELVFSDFDYVEVKLETEKHPQSITLQDDPYRIIRPEGQWDRPGILERSATRGVCEAATQ